MDVLYKYIKKEMKINSFKSRPPKKKKNATIYIARVMNDPENIPSNQTCWLGNCMPCDNCKKNLAKFGIKKIKYTDIIDGNNVVCEMCLV
tara:strand:- start:98 stop:367 length:270 start_codon:yes stop_codon:yes gene_type:complete